MKPGSGQKNRVHWCTYVPGGNERAVRRDGGVFRPRGVENAEQRRDNRGLV